MVGKKRKGTYTSLSLPTELMYEVEEVIKKDSEYRGITEFVKSAIKEKLNSRISKLPKEMPGSRNEVWNVLSRGNFSQLEQKLLIDLFNSL